MSVEFQVKSGNVMSKYCQDMVTSCKFSLAQCQVSAVQV